MVAVSVDLDALNHGEAVSWGYVRRIVMLAAAKKSLYNDTKKRTVLMGMHSGLFFQPSLRQPNVYELNSSEDLWDEIKTLQKKKVHREDGKPVIVLHVALGGIRDNDDPFNLLDEDSCKSMTETDIRASMGTTMQSPPKKRNTNTRQSRAASTTNDNTVHKFIMGCIGAKECELYHALSRKMFERLLLSWKAMLEDSSGKEFCYEKWSCKRGQEHTWPTMHDLPTCMWSTVLFDGKEPLRDAFPLNAVGLPRDASEPPTETSRCSGYCLCQCFGAWFFSCNSPT